MLLSTPNRVVLFGGRHHIDFFAILIVLDAWIRSITRPLEAIT
jgi:hypothetical protein